MRKILLSMTLLLALPSFSQKSWVLVAVDAPAIEMKKSYRYNDKNLVNWIYNYDGWYPEYNSISVLDYDDEGRQTKEHLYQDIEIVGGEDHTQWLYACLIEYTYDDQGRLVQRVNYNNFDRIEVPSDLGGVISYEYDEDGRLKMERTFWDLEKTDEIQRLEYVYNESGLLERLDQYYSDFFTKEFVLSGHDDYSYDEESRLAKVETWYIDMFTAEEMSLGGISFTYDENGRLVKRADFGDSGAETSKNEFLYPDEISPAPVDDIDFPFNIESKETNQLYSLFTEAPEAMNEYAVDRNTGEMAFITKWSYVYERSLAGVGNVFGEPVSGSALTGGFRDGHLVLGGVDQGSLVSVYTTDGSVVYRGAYSDGGIDMSGLVSGTYCVVARNGVIKIRK
ncbi:MAG: hypothetical protein K2L59_04520 [Muribaculaceae bacterium]|nr:hypothetical protein [Muribaculaceae bacterium]